jgi:cysteine-rich repeat protein
VTLAFVPALSYTQGSEFLFRSSFEDFSCLNGVIEEAEQCDDGNADDTDGCTTTCRAGVICKPTAYPDAERFAVDPSSGNCYAAYDDGQDTFSAAKSSCEGAGGHLVTITGVAEALVAYSVQSPAQNPWIGASEDDNDTDAVFAWVTGEPFGFADFAPGEPDDDVGAGGNGDCLHLANAAGQWADTNCNFAGFVTGWLCEFEP